MNKLKIKKMIDIIFNTPCLIIEKYRHIKTIKRTAVLVIFKNEIRYFMGFNESYFWSGSRDEFYGFLLKNKEKYIKI